MKIRVLVIIVMSLDMEIYNKRIKKSHDIYKKRTRIQKFASVQRIKNLCGLDPWRGIAMAV